MTIHNSLSALRRGVPVLTGFLTVVGITTATDVLLHAV
jgi:hypothetical protein